MILSCTQPYVERIFFDKDFAEEKLVEFYLSCVLTQFVYSKGTKD